MRVCVPDSSRDARKHAKAAHQAAGQPAATVQLFGFELAKPVRNVACSGSAHMGPSGMAEKGQS